jgi:hypothetical protein
VLGVVHEATGGWTIPLLLLIVALVPQALNGVLAGRDRYVAGRPDEIGARTTGSPVPCSRDTAA